MTMGSTFLFADLKDSYSANPIMIQGSNDPSFLVSQSTQQARVLYVLMCAQTSQPGPKRSTTIFHRM